MTGAPIVEHHDVAQRLERFEIGGDHRHVVGERQDRAVGRLAQRERIGRARHHEQVGARQFEEHPLVGPGLVAREDVDAVGQGIEPHPVVADHHQLDRPVAVSALQLFDHRPQESHAEVGMEAAVPTEPDHPRGVFRQVIDLPVGFDPEGLAVMKLFARAEPQHRRGDGLRQPGGNRLIGVGRDGGVRHHPACHLFAQVTARDALQRAGRRHDGVGMPGQIAGAFRRQLRAAPLRVAGNEDVVAEIEENRLAARPEGARHIVQPLARLLHHDQRVE